MNLVTIQFLFVLALTFIVAGAYGLSVCIICLLRERGICKLGYHPWVYWDTPSGHRSYRVCPKCKAEEYTRPAFNLWHRVEPEDCWGYYVTPEWILERPNTY